ncbi:uncharacterized protein LODBEIA_P16080 [Lodderomyces beijingensis]|uniref:MARVEL domain-containing protein n=1 Tax=Lodderomyces beijingensis TaxID=1775926 RepID=A0ABP0ZHM6_9ASCO
MAPFRPYGGDEVRVVSDLSRFDFSGSHPKLRSRNTTPTNAEVTESEYSSKLTIDTYIPLYSSRLDNKHRYEPLRKDEKEHGDNKAQREAIVLPKRRRSVERPPVPKRSVGVQVPQDHIPPAPTPPPKDTNLPSRANSKRDFLPYPSSITAVEGNPRRVQLPAMPQPSELYSKGNQQFDEDGSSVSSNRRKLEHDLVRQVMNRPLISFRADRFGPEYHGKFITIAASFFLYLFEICCSIIEIVLASVLLRQDRDVSVGIYRYFVADGSISLIISLLFALQVINYEKRNGSFYCLAATIIKLVSFFLIISYIFPLATYATSKIWSIRRANGAFIIISTFLWVINLVMFSTTLYISRLNLLEELNIDYSSKGVDGTSSKSRGQGYWSEKDHKPLKEYYLNENGEMYALNEDWEKEEHKDKNKILVYTF